MSHPYRKSYIKRQKPDVLPERQPQMAASAKFTLSIAEHTAILNVTDQKIDATYRQQLKNALNGALKKGVRIVKLDLSACDGPIPAIVSALLTLDKSIKIDVLPHPN